MVGVGLNLTNEGLFEGASFLGVPSTELKSLSQKLVLCLKHWTSSDMTTEMIQSQWIVNRRGQKPSDFDKKYQAYLRKEAKTA